MADLEFTVENAPIVKHRAVEYPLVFSVGAMKRWAEYKQLDYIEAIDKGWEGGKLTPEEMGKLLRFSMDAGEARRRLTSTDEREIPDALVAEIVEIAHWAELSSLLALAWNYPPGKRADPQKPAQDPPASVQ